MEPSPNCSANGKSIRYQAPAPERERRFEALAGQGPCGQRDVPRSQRAAGVGGHHRQLAGPAKKAGSVHSSLAKQAKALYEEAIQLDGNVLDGSAYNSLGVLYYKVPGWPLGFGDKTKAQVLLQKALAINPQGIDPNFFYGEYLLETRRADEAVAYLERALQAPPRPGRPLADSGRRDEARALLARARDTK